MTVIRMKSAPDIRHKSSQVIYGINPLWEAIKNNPREILRIAVTSGRKSEQILKILEEASRFSVPVVELDRAKLDRLADSGVHQGIVGTIRPYAYVDLEEMLQQDQETLHGRIVVVLDSITDPQNLGAIIRTAHCFGAAGVIIPQDRSASVTPTVVKASAGAVHHLPVTMVANLSRTLDTLKEKGFWIYGTDSGAGLDPRSVPFAGKIALVMGSEGQGLRDLIRKKCDFLLSIPMIGRIGSLNVSVATGIVMQEMFRGLMNPRETE
ncbi:MAG: 23S rRNA (guanosine(2251)-2'-O)-methyltransferase RlmB [Syntrophales bacterium]